MKRDGNKYARRLDRVRRFCLTVFLYFVFCIGALLVSLLMILPVAAFSRNRKNRMRRVRRINRLAFNAFIRSGVILGVFDVSFIDEWRLNQPGQLIIANHPSLLDVVFLLGRVPNANCVVKNKILKNPFLALAVYFADYIRNDDGEAVLRSCVASLNRGEPVIIFPEGTRTVRNQGYRFKRGAAHLMLMSNCPVRPVYISCEPAALGKKDAWYAIPEQKITYRFTVLDELDMRPIRQAEQMRPPLKSRRLTAWLVDWYEAMGVNGTGESCGKIKLPAARHKKAAHEGTEKFTEIMLSSPGKLPDAPAEM